MRVLVTADQTTITELEGFIWIRPTVSFVFRFDCFQKVGIFRLSHLLACSGKAFTRCATAGGGRARASPGPNGCKKTGQTSLTQFHFFTPDDVSHFFGFQAPGFQIAQVPGLPKTVEAEDTKNLRSRGICHNFSDFRWITISVSKWYCYEKRLIKTVQTIPHRLIVFF